MNLANKLTLTRICLVPFFILFMELGGFFNTIFALVIFCLASITDFFDGQIARKYKTMTSLGVFLDPLADKLLISSAFVCFVKIPYLCIAPWMVIAIVSREFLITSLRSIAAYKNVIIPADKSGRFKTVSQIIVIITTIVIITINEGFTKYSVVPVSFFKFHDNGFFYLIIMIMERSPYWSTFLVVLFTTFSGMHYVFKYKRLLKE